MISIRTWSVPSCCTKPADLCSGPRGNPSGRSGDGTLHRRLQTLRCDTFVLVRPQEMTPCVTYTAVTLALPMDAPVSFATELVAVKWHLLFEFVVAPPSADGLPRKSKQLFERVAIAIPSHARGMHYCGCVRSLRLADLSSCYLVPLVPRLYPARCRERAAAHSTCLQTPEMLCSSQTTPCRGPCSWTPRDCTLRPFARAINARGKRAPLADCHRRRATKMHCAGGIRAVGSKLQCHGCY